MEREDGWTLFVKTGLPQAYTYWKHRQGRRPPDMPEERGRKDKGDDS